MKQLQFINHAAFLYESKDFLFLCDPWIEGTAFNNGWCLLDKSTSNDQLISKILDSNKPLYIWYSHEHSDHFSISFLEKLKLKKPKTKFFFQSTNDNRVASYLNSKQFSCSIIENGKKVKLGSNSWLSIYSWRNGDSLCIIHLDGINILNVNDCILSTIKDCEILRKIINQLGIFSLDILFTQFGYASWCGNEEDVDQRIYEANEKLKRIALQIKFLSPKNTILFASFVYYANKFNFYLNDQQNTPMKVRASKELEKFQDEIYFLKPWDKINFDKEISLTLKSKTLNAEKHWNTLYSNANPISNFTKNYTFLELINKFKLYKKKISKNFLWIFSFLELIRIIKPLRVKIIDIDRIIELSYLNGAQELNNYMRWDIAMYSSDLMFCITKEYGFDCIHVNGRFRVKDVDSNSKFLYFATPQNMFRNGFGLRKPIATIKEFLRLARRRLYL